MVQYWLIYLLNNIYETSSKFENETFLHICPFLWDLLTLTLILAFVVAVNNILQIWIRKKYFSLRKNKHLEKKIYRNSDISYIKEEHNLSCSNKKTLRIRHTVALINFSQLAFPSSKSCRALLNLTANLPEFQCFICTKTASSEKSVISIKLGIFVKDPI